MMSLGGLSGPLLVLILALIIDVTVGEYPNRLHPVVWMGKVIGASSGRRPRPGRARSSSSAGSWRWECLRCSRARRCCWAG